jgi:site-specific DNA-methyltransferase (adenine-specific)
MPGQPKISGRIVHAENLDFLRTLPDASVHLIYIDPPFNTGRVQQRIRMRTVRDANGDRTGFGGARYRTEKTAAAPIYADAFDDFTGFLHPRLVEAHRILHPNGSLFFHIDPRESHYCKVLLDTIFTRACFQNEIIWAYDYGARSKKKWPAKHDTLLWYTKHPTQYTFHLDAADRIEYMAPKLVGAVKAARGKTPTDVWWHTIVSPTGKEKTGYPTQKPLGVLDRIVKVHSSPGDTVLDFFAGSGTTGEAAARNGRNFILADQSKEAVRIMRSRLKQWLTPKRRATKQQP